VVPAEKVSSVRSLGLIKVVADSDEADIRWGVGAICVSIRSSDDEEKIVQLSREKKVIVQPTDWNVIPLENLISRTGNLFVEVETIEEAGVATGILEKGVNGLLVTQRSHSEVRRIIRAAKSESGTLDMASFRIEGVFPLGMGDRVCIDTCSLMGRGEGMLVGNSSSAFFLIHSESLENPYVAPRPFRVNAGAVHAYVLAPGGKTKYLSEIKAGDELGCVNFRGEGSSVIVGRVKIERRPLLLVTAASPYGAATAIVQNAETIRMVRPDGEALSVVDLRPGDEIMGYVEEGGRHFGRRIKETILER
jgi:3-dehydroquinate synthase II